MEKRDTTETIDTFQSFMYGMCSCGKKVTTGHLDERSTRVIFTLFVTIMYL